MNRPIMPGVNSIALDRFNENRAGRYAALYSDSTRGPRRRTCEEAERDFDKADTATGERREAIERFGALSSVFRAWSAVHADFRSEDQEKRHVLAVDTLTGATVLTRWINPEA